jgi:hypothetical protein
VANGGGVEIHEITYASSALCWATVAAMVEGTLFPGRAAVFKDGGEHVRYLASVQLGRDVGTRGPGGGEFGEDAADRITQKELRRLFLGLGVKARLRQGAIAEKQLKAEIDAGRPVVIAQAPPDPSASQEVEHLKILHRYYGAILGGTAYVARDPVVEGAMEFPSYSQIVEDSQGIRWSMTLFGLERA